MRMIGKRIISCLLAVLLVLTLTVPALAAEPSDYIIWEWASEKQGGKVEKVAENTVKVTGSGVWDTQTPDSMNAITYKQQVPVEGFKATMTFNMHYGGPTGGPQSGWYGILLNDKAHVMSAAGKYNTKGILILFKLNRAQKARKRVTIELSTMDKTKGIHNIVGTGITMENLKEDWVVDVEIKGGKLYICGDLCYDINNAIKEMLPGGKVYPSFMGFSEEYLDVSYTVNYVGLPKAETTTKKNDTTTTTKKQEASPTQGGNGTTAEKTTATTAQGGDVTTTTVADGQSTTQAGDPSATTTEAIGTDPTQSGTESDTDTSADAPTESNDVGSTPDTSNDDQTIGGTEKDSNSALPIILIVAAVVVVGAVVTFVLIKRKSPEGRNDK